MLIAIVTVPIAALAFALGAGRALAQVGKGPLAIDRERPQGDEQGSSAADAAVREAEVRQMLEAKAYRQRSRGEAVLDVESEVERLLDEGEGAGDLRRDRELVAEVRQIVIAANERRERQGREPLDVEAEVDARLRRLLE